MIPLLKQVYCQHEGIDINTEMDEQYFDYYVNLYHENYKKENTYANYLALANKHDGDWLETARAIDGVGVEMSNYIMSSEEVKKTISVHTGVTSDYLYLYKKDPRSIGGHTYLDFDLNKACFNVNRLNDYLIHDTDTYEEFVSNFTDEPYIINNKQVRVHGIGAFGGLLEHDYPEYSHYQIITNRQYILDVLTLTGNTFLNTLLAEPTVQLCRAFYDTVSFDVTEYIKEHTIKKEDIETLVADARNLLGIDMHYLLRTADSKEFNIYSDHQTESRRIYYKKDYFTNHIQLSCAPPLFLPQIYHILNGIELTDEDKEITGGKITSIIKNE